MLYQLSYTHHATACSEELNRRKVYMRSEGRSHVFRRTRDVTLATPCQTGASSAYPSGTESVPDTDDPAMTAAAARAVFVSGPG